MSESEQMEPQPTEPEQPEETPLETPAEGEESSSEGEAKA